ncbi:MAG: hypothetical protein S4CHLAM102_01730 [Chlamydiia bacterium]|nr:hypothetical protein [Chlamydiia bacterium]
MTQNKPSQDQAVNRIVDQIRNDTLNPAKEEAQKIVDAAKVKAQEIIDAAKSQAEDVLKRTEEENAKQENVLKVALDLASKQAIARVKQIITEQLFSPELRKEIATPLNNAEMMVRLVDAIVEGNQRGEADRPISLFVSEAIDKEQFAKNLAKNTLDALGNEPVKLADVKAGVEVEFQKEDYSIVISDEQIKQLLAEYIASDLREFVFNA